MSGKPVEPVQGVVGSDTRPIAFQSWHARDLPPLLALHGWMDNSASFDFIAPLIREHQIIAPDLAGHGFSYRRSPDAAYNIWQDVQDIQRLIQQQSLDEFVLMGHSRGAFISSIVAALFPEKVQKLVLLDGVMPLPVEDTAVVDQLKQSLVDRERFSVSKPPNYQSFDRAVQARMQSRIKLSQQAAEVIARRGISHGDQGYFWNTDPRLRGASEMKLNQGQVNKIVDSIEASTLVILREKGTLTDHCLKLADRNEKLKVVVIQGSHHLHMEDTHMEVASMINAFLAE